MTKVTGTKIGRWPVAELPVKLAAGPACMGAPVAHGAPCYGEDNPKDNHYVLQERLGYTPESIIELQQEGVI